MHYSLPRCGKYRLQKGFVPTFQRNECTRTLGRIESFGSDMLKRFQRTKNTLELTKSTPDLAIPKSASAGDIYYRNGGHAASTVYVNGQTNGNGHFANGTGKNGFSNGTNHHISPSTSDRNGSSEDDNMSALDGEVSLDILLPTGQRVQFLVDAKTPMMDVLLRVSAVHKFNPGGKVLKVPSERPPGYLQYKPNTPVGRLNSRSMQVVAKSEVVDLPRKPAPRPPGSLPFEPTIRVQADLPGRRKTFVRASSQALLATILQEICVQNELLPVQEYDLCLATLPSSPLNLQLRLSDLGGISHFAVVSKSSFDVRKSTGDLFGVLSKMPLEEKEKHRRNKNGGFFGLFRKKKFDPSSSETSSLTSGSSTLPSSHHNGYPSQYMTSQQPPVVVEKRPVSMPPISREPELTHDHNGVHSDTAGKKKRPAPAPPVVADPCPDDHSSRDRCQSAGSGSLSPTEVESERSLATTSSSKTSSLECTKKKRAPPPPVVMQNGKRSPSPSRPTIHGDDADEPITIAGDDHRRQSEHSYSECGSPSLSATDVEQSFQEVISQMEQDLSAKTSSSTLTAPSVPEDSLLEQPDVDAAKLGQVATKIDSLKEEFKPTEKSLTPQPPQEAEAIDKSLEVPVEATEPTVSQSPTVVPETVIVLDDDSSPTLIAEQPPITEELHPVVPPTQTIEIVIPETLSVALVETVSEFSASPAPKLPSPVEPVTVVKQPTNGELPSTSVAVTTSPPPVHLTEQRATRVVYMDPQKERYPPTMAVRSFEDDYYKVAQAEDYATRLKYGLNGLENGRPPKEESHRSKVKIPGPFGPVPESPIRDAKVPMLVSPKPANQRLQDEYARLQQMFALWQRQMQVHKEILEGGREIPDDSIRAFQKLQNDLFAQYDHVRVLCDQTETPSPTTPTEPVTQTPAPPTPSQAPREVVPVQKGPVRTSSADKVRESILNKAKVGWKRNDLNSNDSSSDDESSPASLRQIARSPVDKRKTSDVVVTPSQFAPAQQQPQQSEIDTSELVRPSAIRSLKMRSQSAGADMHAMANGVPSTNGYGPLTKTAKPPPIVAKKFSTTHQPPQPTSPPSTASSGMSSPDEELQAVRNSLKRAFTKVQPSTAEHGFGKVVDAAVAVSTAKTNGHVMMNGNASNSTDVGAVVAPIPPPPPPPPPGGPPTVEALKGVKLRPVGAERKAKSLSTGYDDGNGRDALFDAIRSFGGAGGGSLKKTGVLMA